MEALITPITEPDYVRAARRHLVAMESEHKADWGDDDRLLAVRYARIHLQQACAVAASHARILKGRKLYAKD